MALVIAPAGEKREELVKRIGPLGIDVRPMDPGVDAITAVIAETPDLVILIQRLPELDALEALRMIREFDTEIPVFIISNVVKKENVLEAKKYAVSEFIVEPVDYPALLGRVVKHVPVRQEAAESEEDADDQGPAMPGVRTVPVVDVNLGAKLARPIMIDQNTILPENVILDQSHIEKLRKWGIDKVDVFIDTIDADKRVEVKDVDDESYKGEYISIDRGRQFISLGQLVSIVAVEQHREHEFLGSIDDIRPSFFVVGMPTAAARPTGLRKGSTVTVKYGHRGAKIEFQTTVISVERGRDTNVVLNYPNSLYRKQMRKNVRVQVEAPITYKTVTESGQESAPIQGLVNDISAGGLGLLTNEFVRKGLTVLVTFKLNDDLDFTDLRGTVVRAGEARLSKDYKKSAGVVFTTLSDFHKEKLVRYIFDLQREETQVKKPGNKGARR